MTEIPIIVKNQPIDLQILNQWTGFYMVDSSIMKEFHQTFKTSVERVTKIFLQVCGKVLHEPPTKPTLSFPSLPQHKHFTHMTLHPS